MASTHPTRLKVNDAERLTPEYPFWCKRTLFLDDYYSTFNRPNVTLVDDEGGVRRIGDDWVETGLSHSFFVLPESTLSL